MPKKLTLKDLSKESKVFEKKKKIYVLDGQYEVEIYEKFKPTSIQTMLIELATLIDQLKKLDDENEAIGNIMPLYYMQIIRHFTTLSIPLDVYKMVQACQELTDTGILKEIFEAFDQAELAKIGEQMKEFNKVLPHLQNSIGELFIKASMSEKEALEDEESVL